MSDISEIEKLREIVNSEARMILSGGKQTVMLSEAEYAIRSALDRQAREIERWESIADRMATPLDFRRQGEGHKSSCVCPMCNVLRDYTAVKAARFAPKEADPPYSHPECCNPTCPHPDLCEPGCIDRQADAKEADPR